MTCISVGFYVVAIFILNSGVFLRKKYVFSFTSKLRLKMGSKLCPVLN